MRRYEKVIQALSDLSWHSVAEVADVVGARPSSVLRQLYVLLNRGVVIWKPQLSSHGSLVMMFKACNGSNVSRDKPYPSEPLGKEVDEALREAVGDRYYYSGVAARFLYGLIDRFANLNLVEVHVPRKLYRKAIESLIEKVSRSYIVVPDSMPWELINQTMQVATVLRVIPHYRPREKSKLHNRNVQKIDCLLHEIKKISSSSEFRSAMNMAVDQGLIKE